MQWEQCQSFALYRLGPTWQQWKEYCITSGTRDLALQYQRIDTPLTGYSDADWAGDQDERHSTSGNVFMFGGGAICWSSKEQAVVALSIAEAEYIALSAAAQEAAWLQKTCRYIVMMEDNQGGIALVKNTVAHSRTKHINIRFHFIREAQENGLIKVNIVLPKRCWLTFSPSLFLEMLLRASVNLLEWWTYVRRNSTKYYISSGSVV